MKSKLAGYHRVFGVSGRVNSAEQREGTLQKLIAATGCTLTEIISPTMPKSGKLVAARRETAHIIYTRGDNIARASALLRGKGFIVVATERRTREPNHRLFLNDPKQRNAK
jgi:hypothetical protein